MDDIDTPCDECRLPTEQADLEYINQLEASL